MSMASLISGSAVVDGLKFLLRDIETDRAQMEYEKLFDTIQQTTGLATPLLQRLIKFKVVRGEASKHGSLYSIFLVGDAARVCHYLPWRLSGSLVEMHFKTYLVERTEGALEAFHDATWAAPTVVTMSFIKSKPMKGRPKASGDKGIRIGSRKSDKHAVVYRRTSEHPGFETRVRDAEMKAAIAKVELVCSAVQESGNEIGETERWWMLRAIAAKLGYSYALKLLGQMGVPLEAFFSGVTVSQDSSITMRFLPFDGDNHPITP